MARNIEHVVTASGLAVIAKCIALGIPVTFTKASLGTGTAPDADDISTYTNLLTWFDDASIASKGYVGSTLSIAIQYLNTNVENVTNIGEFAIYATDPDLGEVIFSYTTFGQYLDKLLPAQQTPILKTYEAVFDFSNGASVSVTINPEALLLATNAVDEPSPGKLLRLNAQSKLPASITGDAATLGGNAASVFATRAKATTEADGLMSKEDKQKLGQDVSQNASPTFAGLNLNGNIDLKGHVLLNATFEDPA